MSVRVLIVDDHAAMRHSLTQVLELESGVQVVGEAADGMTAIQLVEQLQPDVVVMDVVLPRVDGVDATRRIVHDHPRMIVIGLSVHDSRTYAVRMLQAGARGYVLKDGGVEELVLAMKTARTGHTYLSPGIEGLDRFVTS